MMDQRVGQLRICRRDAGYPRDSPGAFQLKWVFSFSCCARVFFDHAFWVGSVYKPLHFPRFVIQSASWRCFIQRYTTSKALTFNLRHIEMKPTVSFTASFSHYHHFQQSISNNASLLYILPVYVKIYSFSFASWPSSSCWLLWWKWTEDVLWPSGT